MLEKNAWVYTHNNSHVTFGPLQSVDLSLVSTLLSNILKNFETYPSLDPDVNSKTSDDKVYYETLYEISPNTSRKILNV